MTKHYCPPQMATWLDPVLKAKRETLRERIYRTLLSDGPLTRNELAAKLDIKINSVCAPVKEMLQCAEIEELARRECTVTGRRNYPLKVKHQ